MVKIHWQIEIVKNNRVQAKYKKNAMQRANTTEKEGKAK